MDKDQFEDVYFNIINDVKTAIETQGKNVKSAVEDIQDNYQSEVVKFNKEQLDKVQFFVSVLVAYPELADFDTDSSKREIIKKMRSAWRMRAEIEKKNINEFVKYHMVFRYDDKRLAERLQMMGRVMESVEKMQGTLKEKGVDNSEILTSSLEYIIELASKYKFD